MVDFLKSDDINFNLYAIFIIKKYLEENNNSENAIDFLVSQLNVNYMILLTNLLNKDNNYNKKLYYCLLYILINIGYTQNGEDLFSLDEKIVLNVAIFLGNNKNEKTLLYSGIWLIKNISFNDKICQIFLKYKVIEFFEEIYERHLLDFDFMKNMMNCLKNFINLIIKKHKIKKSKDFLCLLPCIKIIKSQIRQNYSADLLFSYIFKLYEITCFNSSEVYYEMTNSKIQNELMNIYPMIIKFIEELKNNIQKHEIDKNNNQFIIIENDEKYKKDLQNLDIYKQICLVILKILGKLMSLDDGILTQNLIDSGIASFLTKVIQSHEVRVIKNAAFCMSNICAGTCGQVGALIKDGTLIELINVSKNIYDALNYNEGSKNEHYSELKDALREINYVFALAIENTIFEKSIPLVRYNNYTIILVLLKGLNILEDKDNEELFYNILKSLYKLIVFDKTEKNDEIINDMNTIDNNNINDNIKYLTFIEVMERNGFKETLEKLQMSKNEVISSQSAKIYDALYNNLEEEDIF